MADTPAQRQALRRNKLRAEGLTQMLVTVPKTPEARAAINALARKLRKEIEDGQD